jgi:hypothetical protein
MLHLPLWSQALSRQPLPGLGRLAKAVKLAADDSELLPTLSAISELHELGTAPLPTPQDASAAMQAASPFVAELLRRRDDRQSPCLLAGYADGESLLIDFERGEVIADPGAWEHLRARRELPRIADGTFRPAGLTHRAKIQRIDALMWATGLAAADMPLLGVAAAWRDERIGSRGGLHLQAFSRAPAHLHLVELLARGHTTPATLRRATRVDERELRAFLQGGLFLGLLEWVRA